MRRGEGTLRLILRAAIFAASLWLCAFFLIRYTALLLYRRSGETEAVLAIFSQLADASVYPPFLVPAAIWFLIRLLFARKRRAPGCILGGLVWLVLFPAVLWFSRVNGILLGTVVRSLAEYFRNGLVL